MPYAAKVAILAEFQQQLVGEWENRDFGTDGHGQPVGGLKNPLSYNVMPLPQASDPDGYILKNFKYYERLKFNNDDDKNTLAIAAEAPNRSGLVTQNVRALFYEQQVKFAEGPAHDNVVHVENGAWLWLPRFVQQPGPYPANIDAEKVTDGLQQPSEIAIAKQIAVPHGNSILALGSFDTISTAQDKAAIGKTSVIPGRPVIPDAPFPYPIPIVAVENPASPPTLKSNLNVDARYTTQLATTANFQNPHPDLTQNPNIPLQQAVEIIDPDSYMHWHVTTLESQHGKGQVIDVPFEEKVSDVTEYFADYWLLFKQHRRQTRRYLAYTQTILMKMLIEQNGERNAYIFPHVTTNTVTYVS